MDFIFKKQNARVTLPEDSIYYKKGDATKLLQLSTQISKYCLIVVGDTDGKTITTLNCLGKSENENTFNEVIETFTEQNTGIGIHFVSRETFTSKEGYSMELLVFNNRKDKVVVVFREINGFIFMSNTNSGEENLEFAKGYAFELMKMLRNNDEN